MYLSNCDIKWAIECGKLIVDPPPESFNAGYDETSIDLHLGPVKTGARIWDIEGYRRAATSRGGLGDSEITLGSFDWTAIAAEYLIEVPEEVVSPTVAGGQRVFRRGQDVIVRQLGFVLWTTKEKVGTPKVGPASREPRRHPELICFVDGKSTRARTGLLVHFTAPTIHAGWAGNVTLEITNLGPFDFVLREGDVIAQLTVATISSAPALDLRRSKQQTQGQTSPSGAPRKDRGRRRGGRKS